MSNSASKSPIHILIVSHGCATAQNQQLVAEIKMRSGAEVTLVVPAAWRDEFGNRLNEAPWPGLEDSVRKVPVWANGRIILHGYRLNWVRYLRQVRPDVIYINHEPYAIATAQIVAANWATWRRPLGFYSCQNLEKRYPFPFSFMESMVYHQSRFAFPITEAVSRVLLAKGFHGERAVAPLALDPHRYHPGLRNVPPAGLLDLGGPRIGFVGRLVESKGLRTLAAALELIRDVPWQLVLVGTGDFTEELRELMAGAGLIGRVQFVGYVPHQETPRWLASLDVLVLPSESQPGWTEQFGRVVPEALACGVPVIGSDSGEIPNLIRASGGGLVFPERNPHALAAVLREFLRDPDRRSEHARVGRTWVEREISLHAVASKMVEVLSRAAKSSAGRGSSQ